VRICLMIEGQEGVSWDDWVALARACEEHGLEGLFRSDHYQSVFDLSGRGSLDAWATLAALAAATERIRLGTMVSPATFRRPSVLSRMVATVDHISGGRVELGLGAGWNQAEHDAHGFPFPGLDERMELLEEQLEIVHRQWTEEEFSFQGRHYRLERCRAERKPLQRPRPPIVMGGGAGPRVARLAARWADEYNTPFASVKQCRERRAAIAEACSDLDMVRLIGEAVVPTFE
jgi:F420-dependent oxidoreductase-like protein